MPLGAIMNIYARAKARERMSGWSCLPRVAALITGEDFEDVLAFIGHDGSERVPGSPHADGVRGFRILEIAQYLAARGFQLGIVAADIPQYYCRRPWFQVTVFTDCPAILIVKGRSGTTNHAVLWTGREVIDTYQGRERKALADYEVLQWWPVARVG